MDRRKLHGKWQLEQYPERFAQEAIGHNSKAVHRAYARQAKVELPSLAEYERQQKQLGEERATPIMVQA